MTGRRNDSAGARAPNIHIAIAALPIATAAATVSAGTPGRRTMATYARTSADSRLLRFIVMLAKAVHCPVFSADDQSTFGDGGRRSNGRAGVEAPDLPAVRQCQFI